MMGLYTFWKECLYPLKDILPFFAQPNQSIFDPLSFILQPDRELPSQYAISTEKEAFYRNNFCTFSKLTRQTVKSL